MYESVALQNVFGTIGTIMLSGQIIPQMWKNYRRKTTFGLSPYLWLIWGISSPVLGVYVIYQSLNVALIIQPQTFGAFAYLCWIQCLYYESKVSKRTGAIIYAFMLSLTAAFQLGMVYSLRAARDAGRPGVDRGVEFFGILSAVMASIGLVPQYYEIFRLKEVVGVSYTFMVVDILGGAFSLLSLAFRAERDAVAGIVFSMIVVLDLVVLVLALVLNPQARRRRARLANLASNRLDLVRDPCGNLELQTMQDLETS